MTKKQKNVKPKDRHDRIAYWTDRFHRSQGWWKPWMTWTSVAVILATGATAIIVPYTISLDYLAKFLHCPLNFAKFMEFSDHLFGYHRGEHYSDSHHDFDPSHLNYYNHDNEIKKKHSTFKPGCGPKPSKPSSTTKRIHCWDYYGKSTRPSTIFTTKTTTKTTTRVTTTRTTKSTTRTTRSPTTQSRRKTTRKCIHANDPRLKWRLPKNRNKTGNKPYIKSMDYHSQEIIDNDIQSDDSDKDDSGTDGNDSDKQHGDDTVAEEDEKELKNDLQKENEAYLQHNHNYLMQFREAKDTAELKDRIDTSVSENSNANVDEDIRQSGNYLVQFKKSGNDLILDGSDLDQDEDKTEAGESGNEQKDTKKKSHFKSRRKNVKQFNILLKSNEHYHDDSDENDDSEEHSDEDRDEEDYYFKSPHEAIIKADFEQNKIHLMQFKNSVKNLEGDEKLEKIHQGEYDQENSDNEYLKQTDAFVEAAKIYEKDVRSSNLDYLKHHENVLSEMKLDKNDVEQLKNNIEDILFLKDFEPKMHNSLKHLQHLRERDGDMPKVDENEKDRGDNNNNEKSNEGQIIPEPPDYNSLQK